MDGSKTAMPTQGESPIPFEIYNEQQQLRLLELPPSLLDLVTSKRLSNLALKSSTPSLPGQPAQNVVLCTNSQTYQVRQVQSSNSVFVLQPSETQPVDDSIPTTSLSAIAQCNAMLELVPVPPAAIGFMKEQLPLYAGLQSFNELARASSAVEKTGRLALLRDAPFSTGEFDIAWKELCIFENDGQAWMPTASMVASVWKSMISAATVRSVDLGDGFSIASLVGAVEEDGFPHTLYEAMVERISSGDADSMEGYTALSKEKAVPWLGAILLESQSASAEGVLTSNFLQHWQDQLPEAWRAYATLDALKGKFSELTKGKIVFKEASGSATASSTPAKGYVKNVRKWHEKFKNARP